MLTNKTNKKHMEKELGDKSLTMRPRNRIRTHAHRHWEAWQLHCNWIPMVILWSHHMTGARQKGPPVEEAIFVLLKSHLSISAAHLQGWLDGDPLSYTSGENHVKPTIRALSPLHLYIAFTIFSCSQCSMIFHDFPMIFP